MAPKKRKSTKNYHGIKKIGEGSYGKVSVAYSNRHKTRVAIKIISKKKAPPEFVNKFLPRELEVIKILKHPNIIAFLQSIETTNRVYVIMELADNGDLLDVIRREGHISEPRAGKWYHQLIDAIEYCHSKGVVHRDIKCENILLDRKNNFKLTDFGFSKSGVGLDNSNAISETFCGSYAYACPEILRGSPYDPRLADVWSSCIVLYVMLFGRLPYDDSNLRALLVQVQRPPDFPSSPFVSDDCKALIHKILVVARFRLHIREIRMDSWFRRMHGGESSSISKTHVP